MANNNDWLINLVGSLDPTKTKDQINDDIEKIQGKLKDVELKAKLESSVVSDLEKQLNNLQVSLTDITIPQSVLDGLVNQINNALRGIQINNVNFNPSGVGNFGRQVGEVVSDEVNNALGKITSPEIGVRFTFEENDSDEFNRAVDDEIRKLQKLNNKMISVRYTTNTEQNPVIDAWGNATGDYEHIEKLTGAVFRYNTETGEAISKTMKWAQIGTTVDNNGNDIPLMGWVQGLTSYNKSLEEATVKTDTFLDKQKQAVATAESKLSKIESELNDKNAPKTLANTDKIANGLNKALQDVRDQIASLGSASRDTFAQAKIDTDAQIVALENLIKRLKNAEYVATSLRTKTFDTVKKDEINNFEPLYQELLKSTAVDKNGTLFSERAKNLHTDIVGATSSDEITTFLNNLSNLKTEYRAVRKQADDTAKATGLLAKKSEALSSLHIFKTANPDVENYKATVGNTVLTVKELEKAINDASSPAELNAAKEQMRAFERAAEDAGKATKSTSTEYETLLKKANEAISTNKYSGSTSQVKTNFEKLDNSLIDDSLRTDYGQLISLSEQLNDSMSNDDKVSTYKELEKLLPSVRNRITELSSAQKNLEEVDKIQRLFDNGHGASDYGNRITKIQQDFEKYGLSAEKASKKTEKLREILNGFKDTNGNFLPADQLTAQADKLEAEFDAIKISVDEAKLAYDKFMQPVTKEKASSLIIRINNFLSKNTAITSEAKEKLESFVRELNQGINLERWNKINLEFKETELQMRKIGKLGESFTQSIKEGMSSFFTWMISSASVMDVIQACKSLITTSKELNSVMTDFTMATGVTESQLKSLTNTYYKLADELRSTTTDVTVSATEWIKQGQSIADIETLVTNAMILSKVGKLDSTEATKYLTSAMKGYKVSVQDTLDVVDKLSAVDMVSATDVGGLAEGMSEVANNANLAGVSMDKLLGYLAVIGETTQSSMSEVGTSLNAIFSRMGNIKLSRLKDYETGEDLSNVETVLRGEDILLRESTGEFRNFGEVLDEVASNWTNYSEVSQRAIASAFAG